jgi:hypothetical protein
MNFATLIKSEQFRYWKSIILSIAISLSLGILVIYKIQVYGMSVFFLIPFLIGFSAPIFYGKSEKRKMMDAIRHSLITLFLFAFALLFFALEGVICIAMAIVPAIPFTILGAFLGFSMIEKRSSKPLVVLFIVSSSIPTMGFIEKQSEPELYKVESTIIVNASPKEVWKQVVEFPQLDPPSEFIFKAGISYPINAKIIGNGVGAIRYCNFNTGSFVEPITRWDAPYMLAFDVKEQPLPMQEISFWDIEAPHLHDYFVSKRGQFLLKELPNGKTKLTGTTWYFNKILPSIYWRPWSDYIIHQIHERVLNHIQKNAENQAPELSLK